jgi:hypothetical protein
MKKYNLLLISKGHDFEDRYDELINLNANFQNNVKLNEMWDKYSDDAYTVEMLDSWIKKIDKLIELEQEKAEEAKNYSFTQLEPYGDIEAEVYSF